MKRVLLAVLTLLIHEVVSAQPPYTLRTYNIRDGLAANKISGIEQDSKGLIWLATWNGLCCYDGYQFTTFDPPETGMNALTTNRILKIRPDSLDNLVVRTYDGNVYLFDTQTCSYKTIADTAKANAFLKAQRHQEEFNLSNTTGLPAIELYFTDNQHNVWLATAKGLTQVTFQQQHLFFWPVMANEAVRAVCCRHDSTIWAGTHEGYIRIFNRDGKPLGWLNQQGQVTGRFTSFSKRIYALYEDTQHNLWIGTKGAGLFILDSQGHLSHYQTDASDPYSLNSNEIYDFDEDDEGHIWIATFGGGPNVVDKGKDLRFIHRDNDLTNYPNDDTGKVRRITHTDDGTMIISTTTGLLVSNRPLQHSPFHIFRHETNDSTSLRTNDVMQTLVSRDGTLYVATMGGGIQRLSSCELNDAKPHFTTLGQLSHGSGNVQSMAEDADGNIWIIREMQLQCYHPKKDQLIQHGSRNMVGELEPTESLPVVDAEGQVWLGAIGNVVTFNPCQMRQSTFRPNIVFTGVRYQGQSTMEPLLYRKKLTLDKDQRSLTIVFAALEFSDNYLVEYAYQMDGKPWNYIGQTPHLSFNELSPGQHVLTVRSTNSDGVWMDNETELLIDVTPMLWERTWFQLLLMIMTLALFSKAILVVRRRQQQSRERDQRLENILRQYRELQQQMEEKPQSQHTEDRPAPVKYQLEEPKIVDEDEEMMSRLMDFIEKHIGEEDLRAEDMASAMNLGRTVFYRKLKLLVGVTPTEFLRQVRIQRAIQLITLSKKPVSEIAYSVGFSDPKYFSKCFKKETGMSPSEYREH